MIAIKSYTDLQQSKKLAKILPRESADMYWYLATKDNPKAMFNEGYNEYGDFELPCWSLVALLSVLPRVDIEKEICSDDTYDYRVKAYIGDGYIGDWYDNPVDACYEMILKLNESNLL